MDRQANKSDWDRLTKLQLGKYAEYFVKMEFTLHRFDVYSSEVDERGVDFVIRTKGGRYYDVQVKSFRLQERKSNYVFVQKEKFRIDPTMLLALAQFSLGELPKLFLILAAIGAQPNPLLESRDYGEGRKSKPEWGITLSQKKLVLLNEQCLFDSVVASL
jgi:hypothetical protein